MVRRITQEGHFAPLGPEPKRDSPSRVTALLCELATGPGTQASTVLVVWSPQLRSARELSLGPRLVLPFTLPGSPGHVPHQPLSHDGLDTFYVFVSTTHETIHTPPAAVCEILYRRVQRAYKIPCPEPIGLCARPRLVCVCVCV